MNENMFQVDKLVKESTKALDNPKLKDKETKFKEYYKRFVHDIFR